MNVHSKVIPKGRTDASNLDIKLVALPSDHCTATVSGKVIKLTTLKTRVIKNIAEQIKIFVFNF